MQYYNCEIRSAYLRAFECLKNWHDWAPLCLKIFQPEIILEVLGQRKIFPLDLEVCVSTCSTTTIALYCKEAKHKGGSMITASMHESSLPSSNVRIEITKKNLWRKGWFKVDKVCWTAEKWNPIK